MFARLLAPGTHAAIEIEHGYVDIEVAADPHPVLVRLVNQENFARFEAGIAYEYGGPDLAALSHEFDDMIDEDEGPWRVILINESAEPVAVAVSWWFDFEDEDDDDEG